ncbi:unnamed protein product [Rotaria socialis]
MDFTAKQSDFNQTNFYPASNRKNQDDLYYIIQQQYGGVWRTFNFEDSFGDCSGESRPFLYVDGNIDLYVLSQFMAKEWKLEKPNLVVPILSAVSRYKIFKNLKMIEALKTGIRNNLSSIRSTMLLICRCMFITKR